MPCITQCGIAVIIIAAQIHMMLTCHRSPVFKEFVNSLSNEQINIYKSVVYERMSLYLQGQIIGLLIGICFIYLAYLNRNNQNSNIKYFNIFGLIVLISVVSYLYYSLSPKTTFMLNHLNTREQNDKWLSTYKEMKYCSITSYLFGIVAYFLLFRGILF